MSLWAGIVLGSAVLSFSIWCYLALGRGFFWWPVTLDIDESDSSRSNQNVSSGINQDSVSLPAIDVIVPARNEAEALPVTLPRLLNQKYPGRIRVFLVDDHSDDGTSEICKEIQAQNTWKSELHLIQPPPLPDNWSGKVWAMHSGWKASRESTDPADWILFTDADIAMTENSIQRLATHTIGGDYRMGSWMVRLRIDSFWDRLLIPAFVYFFAKLYPFRWASNPKRKLAAAAGGCILVDAQALEKAGGLESIQSEIIDDCSLANRIKNHTESDQRQKIWLGMVKDVWSVRPYGELDPTWKMVSRTAFTQLKYSYILLTLTLFGMAIVYLAPPALTIGSFLTAMIQPEGWTWLTASCFVLGSGAWGIMAWTYLPTLAFYGVHWAYSTLLPLSALLYNLMTLDSAWKTFLKKGGAWKGRTYKSKN